MKGCSVVAAHEKLSVLLTVHAGCRAQKQLAQHLRAASMYGDNQLQDQTVQVLAATANAAGRRHAAVDQAALTLRQVAMRSLMNFVRETVG